MKRVIKVSDEVNDMIKGSVSVDTEDDLVNLIYDIYNKVIGR